MDSDSELQAYLKNLNKKTKNFKNERSYSPECHTSDNSNNQNNSESQKKNQLVSQVKSQKIYRSTGNSSRLDILHMKYAKNMQHKQITKKVAYSDTKSLDDSVFDQELAKYLEETIFSDSAGHVSSHRSSLSSNLSELVNLDNMITVTDIFNYKNRSGSKSCKSESRISSRDSQNIQASKIADNKNIFYAHSTEKEDISAHLLVKESKETSIQDELSSDNDSTSSSILEALASSSKHSEISPKTNLSGKESSSLSSVKSNVSKNGKLNDLKSDKSDLSHKKLSSNKGIFKTRQKSKNRVILSNNLSSELHSKLKQNFICHKTNCCCQQGGLHSLSAINSSQQLKPELDMFNNFLRQSSVHKNDADLPSYDVLRIEDAMKQTINLAKHFMESYKMLYHAYFSTLASPYKYTSLYDIEKGILDSCHHIISCNGFNIGGIACTLHYNRIFHRNFKRIFFTSLNKYFNNFVNVCRREQVFSVL